jgi:hypothetical protein
MGKYLVGMPWEYIHLLIDSNWTKTLDEGCWKKEKTGTEWGKGTNNWRLK